MNLLVLALVQLRCCCDGAAGQTDRDTSRGLNLIKTLMNTQTGVFWRQCEYVLVVLDEIPSLKPLFFDRFHDNYSKTTFRPSLRAEMLPNHRLYTNVCL